MLDELTRVLGGIQSPVALFEGIIAVGFSLIASIVAYFMYQLFYGSRHIGAGVHRTFIIGGPAITALFLGIQTSIPLSLGLLGALSFVRFRTPIKDPAEVGFILLLIASSIGAATNNYLVTVILFALVFVSLSIQHLTQNRFGFLGLGHLMISVDRPSYSGLQAELSAFLQKRLRGLSLETMSVVDNRVSFHYQYRRRTHFDWTAFTNDFNKLTAAAQIEMSIS